MNEKAELWNAQAGHLQEVFALGPNDYNTSLLHFWVDSGMLFPGCRFLDIGCGVGKYGAMLARLGYDVTLTDISEAVLLHAKENMSGFHTPWKIVCADFDIITGQEEVFKDGFDLTISTMSPAIHDEATVRKMSSMTRGWCFLTRFCDWKQPMRDRILADAGIITSRKYKAGLREDTERICSIISGCGYRPDIRYVDYIWSDDRSPEQMTERILDAYQKYPEVSGAAAAKILTAAGRAADGKGILRDEIQTKAAWIWWKA